MAQKPSIAPGGREACASRRNWRVAIVASALVLGVMPSAHSAFAQDLTPRAYAVSPLRSNAILVTDVYNDGDLNFEGTVPIEDATGKINALAAGFYHSLALFGRSANVNVVLPYGTGTFEGNVLGSPYSTHRAGLFDIPVRFALNLVGGPAMPAAEWAKWQQKTLLGASVKVVIPVGQYDPTRLINLGSNRWAFKPELGLSQRIGHWILDAYGAAWFFTRNPEFFSRNAYYAGTRSQSQEPIGIAEMHLSYDVRPRLWVSLDGNFWSGGKTRVSGVENPNTLQKNSRVGVTPRSRSPHIRRSSSASPMVPMLASAATTPFIQRPGSTRGWAAEARVQPSVITTSSSCRRARRASPCLPLRASRALPPWFSTWQARRRASACIPSSARR